MTPKKIAAFAIGPVGGALLGLISLPVITWFFSQDDVGRMAMLQVTIGFSTLLFSLGLDQAYVREFHETGDKPALLKQSVLPGLFLLIITVAVLLSFGDSLAGWILGIPEWHLSMLIAIALLAAFVGRFLSLVLRMRERGLAFSASQILPKVLLLVIVGSYVLADADKTLTHLVLATTLSLIAVVGVFGFNTRQEWMAGIASEFNVQHTKKMLRFGFPLIMGGIAFWGLTSIDKLFLRTLASFEELGIYSVSVSFAGAATVLQSVFSVVWAPMVYKWASTGRGLENVHRVSRYILALVVLGFLTAALLSWVVTIFLPPNYTSVQWIVVCCIGYPLLYTLSETTVVGIGISRRTSFAMLAAVLAFAVNILGNWFLIPKYGSAGAAASTCVAFWAFFILRTEFSIYLWKKTPRALLYTYTTLSVAGAVVFTLWGEEFGSLMRGFWLLLFMSWLIVFKSEVLVALRLLNRGIKNVLIKNGTSSAN